MANDSCSYVVEAYIHSDKDKTFVPKEVKTIISRFCPMLDPFQWNTNDNEHGPDWNFNGYKLPDDEISHHGHKSEQFSIVKSKNIISAFIVKKMKWAVKITRTVRSELVAFQLGFFPSDKEKMIKYYDDELRYMGLIASDIFAIMIEGNYACRYPSEPNIAIFDHSGDFYQGGDEFSLLFDFEHGTCTFLFNNESIDRCYDHIPQSVVPAISVSGGLGCEYNFYFSSEFKLISF